MKPLSNPPIKEAIIALSFLRPIGRDVIEDFCSNEYINNRYQEKQSLVNLTITKRPGASESDISANHSHEGYALIYRADAQETIQIKLGGISFHNTGHYLGWEEFINRFEKIWSIFLDSMKEDIDVNLNLRYLNEIFIDVTEEQPLESFLNFLPSIPNTLSDVMDAFFIQVQIPRDDTGHFAIITQNAEAYEGNKVKVTLDIQILPSDTGLSKVLLNDLDKMRSFKNDVFEGCLTKKTIEVYE